MQDLETQLMKTKIFLYGVSGSGKSTVGKVLAGSLGLPFVDLDLEIENRNGMQIHEIFEREGEKGFRQREQQALMDVMIPGEAVVALGGGTLTQPLNRTLVEQNGQVVLLTATFETLLSRLQKDTITRPLIAITPMKGGQPLKEGLNNMLDRRASHYAAFPNQIRTDGESPHDIAWQIQTKLGCFHVHGMANIKYPGYDVRIQPGGLTSLGAWFRARGLGSPVAVVTDDNVGAHYLDRVLASLRENSYAAQGITIPAGESQKTLVTIEKLWEDFLEIGIERGSTVLALGGGVVGDLSGFAAATFLRGISWAVAPTSLLAMVDSSLGGKTGFDLAQGKNLIGAFHPPRLVVADPAVLGTLPRIEWTNGLAEVLKHGIIADPDLFTLCLDSTVNEDPILKTQIVRQGMAVKIRFIEADPYEKDIRAALNYGHTVGHGIELASQFRLRHGEAIAIGMAIEARLAEQIGLAKPGLADQIVSALQHLGLPVEIPQGLDREMILAAMRRDKKTTGGIVKFSLPAAIGDVRTGIVVDSWENLGG